MLMHLADQDEFISKEAQAKIKAKLSDKPNAVICSYPGCNHALARHTGAQLQCRGGSQGEWANLAISCRPPKLTALGKGA
jgi:carboxymethylenebutenolidase